jgi:glycosyltransferase involved in cell wall biosynthesis
MGLTKLPSAVAKKISQSPLILTVGAVKERKGQLDTFKAVLLLKEKYPDILYVTIGSLSDTVYVSEIRKLGNEKHIQMLENITDNELSEWYARTNVFCLNSNNGKNHFEGFGLVILEAGQFGVPSVGSVGCGIESAIKDGASGYLSKQGDAHDIADKIERALQIDRKEVITFTKTFDWDLTVKNYMSYYVSEK